ncbi:MMPL family transporter [Conexibacter sp. W3-3-2]|uniref:MMPL family transporter n=1 Tax=Conexibacter sp. W3-3-2 TaxID=2675227 RepID=UPI0012B7EB81|nr:MMPL family transporter [Conexibacter sp. W3-3-2]MTD43929.1 MMPL family transporter [Conexibacter sp. W3-3-2]
MTRFLAFPAGRRSKWVVLATWIVILGAVMGTGLPGKFADAEKNESTSFLPGDAESTTALKAVESLQDGEQAPTVIVYRRADGLTAQDKATIVSDVEKLNALKFRNTTPFGNPTGPDAREPFQLSQDGTTALIANSIEGDGESDTLIDPVDAYRELVSDEQARDRPDGLQVKVTGPAGISADAIKVFENINGTLLGAAVLLVLILLIIIYRSPIFWFFPLFSVIVAEIVSRGLGYGVSELGVTINGQSSSITSILVLGAGTDYALLLVSRYREELRRHEDKHEAMALALKSAGPAIIASAATVSIALFALILAKVNGTAGLGPLGALGVLTAMLVQLTFLPALLVAVGRKPFWPRVPRFGDEGADATHGSWRRLGERIERNPRRIWIGTAAILALFCLGLLNFSTGLTQGNSFRDDVEAIAGQKLVEQGFPAGQSAPTDIVVRDPAKVDAVIASVSKAPGVAAVRPTPFSGEQGTLLAAFLEDDPYSTTAFDRIDGIRAAARAGDPQAVVGGPTAVEKDLRDASADDTTLLIPLTLVIVFLILLVLLRAVTATLLLMGTVLLSFGAALGVASIVFDVAFGFPGSDPSFPLFAFIFLVALGVDYNIFLMARVREETLTHGTRDGMLRGLAVTGGVITSAGVVLAGTFAVLAVLPLVFLTEIGFTIAFGVLLDTFIVRSILVPALVLDVGPKVWWPSALARGGDGGGAPH